MIDEFARGLQVLSVSEGEPFSVLVVFGLGWLAAWSSSFDNAGGGRGRGRARGQGGSAWPTIP